uniref:Expressed protein n=1 Tax=Echinococcus granulosus TaxID=6210 RepID=A0A068WIJ5_ECHGR|nr:expressed protein [Echinococcus granulosus]
MSYYIVDSMYEQVPPLSRGVVLEVMEQPESQRQNYMAKISRRASVLSNELFLGSLTNVNINARRRRMSSIFRSRRGHNSVAE